MELEANNEGCYERGINAYSGVLVMTALGAESTANCCKAESSIPNIEASTLSAT